jgi:transposase InsO family protein
LEDARSVGLCYRAILEEEKEAVIRYALEHPKDGYRRLCWQMMDEDVAYMSPSSVYRVLDDADLLYRWKRSRRSGEKPPEPAGPNERWHVDLMYLRIRDTWYFLVTVLDAYSRYVVHWKLLSSMRAADVRLVVQEALELTGATPEIVSDNGSQFTSREFKHMVRLFELEHIRIRTYHPESNGRLERFHRTTREALNDVELETLGRARVLIGRWVEHYNEGRLHAALEYLPPAEYYRGDPEARIAKRREKLERARARREDINRQRLEAAA